MKLNTGKIAFPIEFDNGDSDVIYFNPNDPDLMVRLMNFRKIVAEKINEIDDADGVELTNEGKPKLAQHIEIFEKMQKIMKDEIDIAFGSNISSVVFKHCSPFALTGGEYFVVQFIAAITPEIERCIADSKKEADAKIAKYVQRRDK